MRATPQTKSGTMIQHQNPYSEPGAKRRRHSGGVEVAETQKSKKLTEPKTKKEKPTQRTEQQRPTFSLYRAGLFKQRGLHVSGAYGGTAARGLGRRPPHGGGRAEAAPPERDAASAAGNRARCAECAARRDRDGFRCLVAGCLLISCFFVFSFCVEV